MLARAVQKNRHLPDVPKAEAHNNRIGRLRKGQAMTKALLRWRTAIKSIKEEDLAKGELHIHFWGLTANDFRRILLNLSCPRARERRPRKCQRYQGIAEIIAKLPPSRPIWKLILVGCKQLDAGTEHLQLLPSTVTDLELRWGLAAAGVKNVCEMLMTNQSITRMIMWSNLFGDEGAKNIGDMLQVNRTIRELGIYHSYMSPTGFSHLSDGLMYNDTLRMIALVGEDVGDEYVQQLCPGLTVNKGLETLDLTCSKVSEKGLEYLIHVVAEHNFFLKEVRISLPLYDDGFVIRTGPGSPWNKLCSYLELNQLNRKLIYDENSTWSDWTDALLASVEAKNLDAIYLFLRNKPELCSGVRAM